MARIFWENEVLEYQLDQTLGSEHEQALDAARYIYSECFKQDVPYTFFVEINNNNYKVDLENNTVKCMGTLGPKNKVEEVVFAEEEFRCKIQQSLYKAMNEKNISSAELANRLCLRQSDVEMFFESEWNPDIKQVARILNAINKEIELC